MSALRIPKERLEAIVTEALERVGVPTSRAQQTSAAMVMTDAWGVSTHGVRNLAGYLARIKAGGIKADAKPFIAHQGRGWAIVDGDNGMGQISGVSAMQLAIEKALETGIGYVGVRNTCHFGGAGYYAWLAARKGQLGISMSNDLPTVAAPGSRHAVMGSNPIAYSIPAGRHPPLLFDISTATVAGGKVYAARSRGEAIPDSWLLDDDGNPTTDPSEFPARGSLQPAAGHKGYGLAILIEILGGVITGAAVRSEVGNWMWGEPSMPTGHGCAFMAMDLTTLEPEFESRMEALVDELHESPTADGVERVLVPGDLEWRNHETALNSGVELPSEVVTKLREALLVVGLDDEELLPVRQQ